MTTTNNTTDSNEQQDWKLDSAEIGNVLAAAQIAYRSRCPFEIDPATVIKICNELCDTRRASLAAVGGDTQAVRRARDWLKTYEAEKYYEGIQGMFRYVAQLIGDLLAVVPTAASSPLPAEPPPPNLLEKAIAQTRDCERCAPLIADALKETP